MLSDITCPWCGRLFEIIEFNMLFGTKSHIKEWTVGIHRKDCPLAVFTTKYHRRRECERAIRRLIRIAATEA